MPSRPIHRKRISMGEVIAFPQFPEKRVFLAYYSDVAKDTLSTIKAELTNRNPEYDYCFLSTTHLISLEQLRCAIHKAIQNITQNRMKANSVNTEIIFNLSPVNNINDALKRFGVDVLRTDVIVIRVCESDAEFSTLQTTVSEIFNAQPVGLTDQKLLERCDQKKFRKLFKSSNMSDRSQAALTRDAISASLLRGL